MGSSLFTQGLSRLETRGGALWVTSVQVEPGCGPVSPSWQQRIQAIPQLHVVSCSLGVPQAPSTHCRGRPVPRWGPKAPPCCSHGGALRDHRRSAGCWWGRRNLLSPPSPALEGTLLHPWAPRRECWPVPGTGRGRASVLNCPKGPKRRDPSKRLRKHFWAGVGLAQGWRGLVCASLGTCGWQPPGLRPPVLCPLSVRAPVA